MSDAPGQLPEITQSPGESGLPELDTLTKGAFLSLFGGPLYLIIATVVGWTVSGLVAALAVAAFVFGFAVLVVRMKAGSSTSAAAAKVPRVSAVSWRLGGLIARILPPGDQVRYAEEFTGELFELASAGAGRFQQIGYIIRLATRVLHLRAELRREALGKVSL